MNRIYLDNGATSFPKAPGVSEAMCHYIDKIGCNVGRGSYAEAFDAQRVIQEVREKLCLLFNFDHSNHVVLTKNITESLNVLIKGLLEPGDHVIVSPMEHNAVMRPLTSLEKDGVTFSRADCDEDGNLDLSSIEPLIQPTTKAIIMLHASNVCGTILDLEAVGRIAKVHGLWFIVDAAQTAGALPVDMKALGADVLAFTGHKALLGPQGTGGFLISPAMVEHVKPLIEGGTGSASDSENQPNYMPDKFEAGTPNTVGLFGLHAALCYLEEKGIARLQEIEMQHAKVFIDAMNPMDGIRIVGRSDLNARTAVVSLDFIGQDNGEIAWLLEQNHGISTRVGMHCAPSAHKTLKTFPQGTVRFSFSPFTTEVEVKAAIEAVSVLVRKELISP